VKNILLQHYEGELSDVAKISIRQMQEYAEKVGAEYRLLTGKPFMPGLRFQGKKALCNNKMAMINEEFDDYDVVVMVDPDIVLAKRDNLPNIFTEETGIGMLTDHIRNNAWKRIQTRFPLWTNNTHLFASGSIWRLEKHIRKRLREEIVPHEVKVLGDSIFVDEGIMHRLCVLANIKAIDENILPQKWSYCSYLPNPKDNGVFIHLRKTPPDKSETITKFEAYRRLHKKGEVY